MGTPLAPVLGEGAIRQDSKDTMRATIEALGYTFFWLFFFCLTQNRRKRTIFFCLIFVSVPRPSDLISHPVVAVFIFLQTSFWEGHVLSSQIEG